ncbi:MAG: HTH domain-containing protein [Candidatus Oxydemutatoraceae bacterium WSBS_2016_MAG_OTU14]
MNLFKDSAYTILKEAGKPLHSKEITKIALERSMLVADGKTSPLTMNSELLVDINTLKERSRFVKTNPFTFGLNKNYVPLRKLKVKKAVAKQAEEKRWAISKDISSVQKGDITEARVAELIMLYGDTTLSCYKPISDDEGIDLIVKEKGSLRTMYIQVKSRFGDNPNKSFTSFVKASGVANKFSMAIVFCFFDTEEGDLGDHLWFVPAPDFLKLAKENSNGMLRFTAGSQKNEANKWDEYLIDKRDLANQILAQMKKV